MYGKIVSYKCDKNVVEITFQNKTGYLKIITDEIINICDEKEITSFAIENFNIEMTDFSIRFSNHLEVKTKKIVVIIKDDFKVDFVTLAGDEICLDYYDEKDLYKNNFLKQKVDFDQYSVLVRKKLHQDECFYGLGDRTGFLNKRGYEYIMWNTDDPSTHHDGFKSLYKSIPFFIGIHNMLTYGIFFDNTYKTYFDLGKTSDEFYYFGAKEGHLNYYFIYGKNIGEVVKNYTYLTGRYPLPQKWTLGYQQSRWSYATEEEVRWVANKFKENNIPIDVIHLDIDYMENYKIFTTSSSNFPHFKELVNDLAESGIKVVTIIDPGTKVETGYHMYDEGIENNYFALDKSHQVYENSVWPGRSVFPSFTSSEVRSWWKKKVKILLDLNVRGIWTDMNEPASFNGPLPDDVIFPSDNQEYLHKEVHNVYGHLMAKATYEGLEEFDQRRPYVITRACFSGSQKYSTIWTGDNQSIWAHLQMSIPQLCNLGLSGMPFAGTDIGGFGYDTTKELLLRWVQAAVFVPLFRNHSSIGTRNQEPWAFDDETTAIYRKYVKLRYEYIPMLYDLFYYHQADGSPIIRPLVYNYQEDCQTKNLNDQYLVGDSLLVAPVVEQGKDRKMVYLPEGEWIDYWTKEVFLGKQFIIKEAPLDTLPIFIKNNSIIVKEKGALSIDSKKRDYLIIEIYGEKAEYKHFLDDGESFDYRQGNFTEYLFEFVNNELKVSISNNKFLYDNLIVRYQNKEITVALTPTNQIIKL